ncbi:E3 ubiquitin-protein ligase RNF4-like isoform X1 [Artemia franciscana]
MGALFTMPRTTVTRRRQGAGINHSTIILSSPESQNGTVRNRSVTRSRTRQANPSTLRQTALTRTRQTSLSDSPNDNLHQAVFRPRTRNSVRRQRVSRTDSSSRRPHARTVRPESAVPLVNIDNDNDEEESLLTDMTNQHSSENEVIDLTCESDIVMLDEDFPVVIQENPIENVHRHNWRAQTSRASRRAPSMLDIQVDVDLPRARTQGQRTVNVTIDLDRSDYFPHSPSEPPPSPDSDLGISSEAQGSSEATVQCGICFDTLGQMKTADKKVMSTFCGHLFCGPCLSSAIKNARVCPQCRKTLTLNKIHQIFI